MEHDAVSMSVHDYDAIDCSSEVESPSPRSMEISRNDGILMRLEEEDQGNGEYTRIKRSFQRGVAGANVVAIHRNSYSSLAGRAKLEAFQVFSRATAEKRGGDANVKLGWYGGGGWDEIHDIVVYGFGRCAEFDKDESSYGIGIHLSPPNLPMESALKAKEDEGGVRHVLLCRVILGSTETISAGSRQFQPSSTHFDSGIDNPSKPTKYIIWSAYMNTHIFPNYIVSFTVPSSIGSARNSLNLARKPSSPSMKFTALLNVLSRFLNPSKMSLIVNYYTEFRENKIDRSQLITRLRSLVGDKILISVIKLCKDEVNC